MRTWLLLLMLGAWLGQSPLWAQEDGFDPETLIAIAGNAEDEKTRHEALKQLVDHPELGPAARALMPVASWWANGRQMWEADQRWGQWEKDRHRAAENGYLCGWFYPPRLRPTPRNKRPGTVPADSPLHPLWCLYRGRMLLWMTIQNAGWPIAQREPYEKEARERLKTAAEAFPNNRIIRMYLGEPIPWSADFEHDTNAPRWANLQREGLEKLVDVINWWIDNRQLSDGQFGGGWGDDVEMWRWWATILIAFDDPKVNQAQERLSRGLLSLPYMKDGYTSILSDVEHTGEDTSDTITPMMHLYPDDSQWSARAMRLAELMRDHWTSRNRRGFLQFKSTWFSVNGIDLNPSRACDTVYHPRAVQPALLLWQRTADPELTQLFTAWMDTWVDAAARKQRSKPAGIIPSAIHWPEGDIGGGGQNWWQPGNYPTGLYDWPSAMYMMTRTLLLTYHMTGEAKYLEPIRSMARIRAAYLADPPDEQPAAGSEAWCAARMKRFLPQTLAQYRLLTGSNEFDALLRTDADGYIQMRLGMGREALVASLERTASAFRINRPAYTSEARFTDRVLGFHALWYNRSNNWSVPMPAVRMLYTSATGDPGDGRYFPMNAVRWLTSPRQIATLVTDSGSDRFSAELYHFGNQPRKMAGEFYLLSSGNYRLALLHDGKPENPSKMVTVNGQRTRIRFELPARKLCVLKIIRMERNAQ